MTLSPTSVLKDSADFLRRGQSKALRQWQRVPLMDRWLFGELLGPLLFGVAAFTAVTLSVGTLFELVRKVAEAGLPVTIALKVLLLRLPGFMVYSFPMAVGLQPFIWRKRAYGTSQYWRSNATFCGSSPCACRLDEYVDIHF